MDRVNSTGELHLCVCMYVCIYIYRQEEWAVSKATYLASFVVMQHSKFGRQ